MPEFRALRKRAGICRDCGQEDAYTMAGRTYCFDCAKKQRIAKQKARNDPQTRRKMLDQHTHMKDTRKANGLCPTCGRKTDGEHALCPYCRAKARKSTARHRAKQNPSVNYPRGSNGICFQCNKAPVMDSKKLCADCYAVKLRHCQSLTDTG